MFKITSHAKIVSTYHSIQQITNCFINHLINNDLRFGVLFNMIGTNELMMMNDPFLSKGYHYFFCLLASFSSSSKHNFSNAWSISPFDSFKNFMHFYLSLKPMLFNSFICPEYLLSSAACCCTFDKVWNKEKKLF